MPALGRKGPSKAVRPGGGFRSGNFGGFNEEHLEQGSTTQAVSQFSQNQQAAAAAQQSTGGSALKQASEDQQGQKKDERPARAMGTIKQELIKRPTKDFFDEIKHLFSLHRLLNIDSSGDSPEDKAKKKQMVQRLSKINDELKQVAEQNYQKELEKKKKEEEEEQRKKEEEERRKQEHREAPKKTKKGAVGPGGKSRRKTSDLTLERNRKGIGRVGGSH